MSPYTLYYVRHKTFVQVSTIPSAFLLDPGLRREWEYFYFVLTTSNKLQEKRRGRIITTTIKRSRTRLINPITINQFDKRNNILIFQLSYCTSFPRNVHICCLIPRLVWYRRPGRVFLLWLQALWPPYNCFHQILKIQW